MRLERTQKETTVVEVILHLKNKEDNELMQAAIGIYLEDCSGSELTEAFEQVNCFGCVKEDEDQRFYVNFLGPTHDFNRIEKSVRAFLDDFQEELHEIELKEDWLEDLESDHIPAFTGHEIIITRPYQW